jgi:hypothetical protein
MTKKESNMYSNMHSFTLASRSSTVVQHSTHNPKIECSNPATATGIDILAKGLPLFLQQYLKLPTYSASPRV